MPGSNVRSWFARIALAAALGVVAAPAQAVIYISNFDPLDFFGTATFDVDPSCLTSDGLKLNDGLPCSVDWLDATVTLVDGLDTLTYTYAAFLPSATAVLSIDVLGGELVGVASTAIGPVVIAGEPVASFNGSFELSFSGDVVSLIKDGVTVATADAIFQIPEPGGLALALGGLAAGCWLARRSRRLRRAAA